MLQDEVEHLRRQLESSPRQGAVRLVAALGSDAHDSLEHDQHGVSVAVVETLVGKAIARKCAPCRAGLLHATRGMSTSSS